MKTKQISCMNGQKGRQRCPNEHAIRFHDLGVCELKSMDKGVAMFTPSAITRIILLDDVCFNFKKLFNMKL